MAPGAFGRAALKQVRHIAMHKWMLLTARHRPPCKAAYFHPGFPHPYSVVYRLFHGMGVAMRRGMPPSQGAGETMAFLWFDGTYVDAATARGPGFVNGNCTDISKRKVESLHCEVFGYSLEVDPLSHQGPMVCKSDENGAHDGGIVQGPLAAARPDCVYQTVVDSRGPAQLARAGEVCDLRVTVFDGVPNFVYLKYRPEGARFANTNSRVLIASLSDVFSAGELLLLTRFCQAAGFDYGEVDVVRDEASRRIHVLDLNKTPLGPPNGLSRQDRRTAFQLYRMAFSSWMARP